MALVLLLTSGGHLDSADIPSGDQRTNERNSPQAPTNEVDPRALSLSGKADREEAFQPSPQRRLRWLVQAPLFGLGIGPLPKPHPALGLGWGLERGALSLRIVGQWGLAQQIPARAVGYGADMRRASISVWACAEVSRSPFSVLPCLQASLTHVFGRGYGPSLRSAFQSETSGALGLGLLNRWRINDRLAVLAGGGVQVELSRPVLLLEPLGTVEQLAPFSATLLLGPEWIF